MAQAVKLNQKCINPVGAGLTGPCFNNWDASGCVKIIANGGRTDRMYDPTNPNGSYFPQGFNGNRSSVTHNGNHLSFKASLNYGDLIWKGWPTTDCPGTTAHKCWVLDNDHPLGPCEDLAHGTRYSSGNPPSIYFTGIATTFDSNSYNNAQWPGPNCSNQSKAIPFSTSLIGSLPDIYLPVACDVVGGLACSGCTFGTQGQMYLCARTPMNGCAAIDAHTGNPGGLYNPVDFVDAWNGRNTQDSWSTNGIFAAQRYMGYGLDSDTWCRTLQNPSFGYSTCNYDVTNFNDGDLANFDVLVNSYQFVPGYQRATSAVDADFYNTYMAQVCLQPCDTFKINPCTPGDAAHTCLHNNVSLSTPSRCMVMFEASANGALCQSWFNEPVSFNMGNTAVKQEALMNTACAGQQCPTCDGGVTLQECQCVLRDYDPNYAQFKLYLNQGETSGCPSCWWRPCQNGNSTMLIPSSAYFSCQDCKVSTPGQSCQTCPNICQNIQKVAENTNSTVQLASQVLNCSNNGGQPLGPNSGVAVVGGSFNGGIAQYWWVILVVGMFLVVSIVGTYYYMRYIHNKGVTKDNTSKAKELAAEQALIKGKQGGKSIPHSPPTPKPVIQPKTGVQTGNTNGKSSRSVNSGTAQKQADLKESKKAQVIPSPPSSQTPKGGKHQPFLYNPFVSRPSPPPPPAPVMKELPPPPPPSSMPSVPIPSLASSGGTMPNTGAPNPPPVQFIPEDNSPLQNLPDDDA